MEAGELRPSAVTWAILGLLALGSRTGYDIKAAIDRSIRHFWAASYGQIYPELKRLEEAGWVAGEHAPRGGRSRRVYGITPAGRCALRGWMLGRETRIELRDESLLRLFFADTLDPEGGLGLLHARREGYRAMLAYLQEVEARPGEDPPFVDLVLRWGIDYCEWGIHWCQRQERRLRQAA